MENWLKISSSQNFKKLIQYFCQFKNEKIVKFLKQKLHNVSNPWIFMKNDIIFQNIFQNLVNFLKIYSQLLNYHKKLHNFWQRLQNISSKKLDNISNNYHEKLFHVWKIGQKNIQSLNFHETRLIFVSFDRKIVKLFEQKFLNLRIVMKNWKNIQVWIWHFCTISNPIQYLW